MIKVEQNFPKGGQSYKKMGTAYELHAQAALCNIGIKTEVRGCTGDGGVDLRGTWYLGKGKDATREMESRALNVIGQCKRMNKPLTPNIIRELEGTFQHCAAAQSGKEHVALMISRTGASKQTLERIRTSQVPITFIRLIDAIEDDVDASISLSNDEEAVHLQIALSQNNGLVHALMNQVMQSKYPEVSVVMKRFRMDGRLVYLPVFVYNGMIIEPVDANE